MKTTVNNKKVSRSACLEGSVLFQSMLTTKKNSVGPKSHLDTQALSLGNILKKSYNTYEEKLCLTSM